MAPLGGVRSRLLTLSLRGGVLVAATLILVAPAAGADPAAMSADGATSCPTGFKAVTGGCSERLGESGAKVSLVLPAGFASVTLTATGGQGGSNGGQFAPGTIAGGLGGEAKATFAVTGTEALEITVGGHGDRGGATSGGKAGFDGGGAGGAAGSQFFPGDPGGGGGGATFVRGTSGQVLVAAGGGGGGGGPVPDDSSTVGTGGAGGGAGGDPGRSTAFGGGAGGGASATTPGSGGGVTVSCPAPACEPGAAGSKSKGGAGGLGTSQGGGGGGGGGGGYRAGGGGGGASVAGGGGGGGGSGFVAKGGTSTSLTGGVQHGNGYAIVFLPEAAPAGSGPLPPAGSPTCSMCSVMTATYARAARNVSRGCQFCSTTFV